MGYRTHTVGCTHLVMVWMSGREERDVRSNPWVWAGTIGEWTCHYSGKGSRGRGICCAGFGSGARRGLRGKGLSGGWGVTEAAQRLSRRRQQSITT